jgi:hypothetical protein
MEMPTHTWMMSDRLRVDEDAMRAIWRTLRGENGDDLTTAVGGILLGGQIGSRVIVTRAAAVHDPAATADSWRLDAHNAKIVLTAAQRAHPDDTGNVVGVWCGMRRNVGITPSTAASLARESAHFSCPIALLMCDERTLSHWAVADAGEIVEISELTMQQQLHMHQIKPPVRYGGLCPSCDSIAEWVAREGAAPLIHCATCDAS